MTLTQPHTDRRVLDPTQRAELAHNNGGYDVIAGEGRVWRPTYDDAYVTAYMHNAHSGFETHSDRRSA